MQPNKVNLITTGSKFEGTIEFNDYTRFEGQLSGTLIGNEGSEIIIGQNGVVDGKIEADQITIDGYVRGEIVAQRKVIVSGTGRVVGDIVAPSIEIAFGGFFEGKCRMEKTLPAQNP